jgi:serine carboxypeptidase 1
MHKSILKATFGINIYNINSKTKGADTYFNTKLVELMNNEVKQALNIPQNVTFESFSDDVFFRIDYHKMIPVTDLIEKLLNETDVRIVVYSGTMDLICPTPGTVLWINNLKWDGKEGYSKAERTGIYIDGALEGYEKHYEKLSMYWVLRSGHWVPSENPAAGNYILKQTINV